MYHHHQQNTRTPPATVLSVFATARASNVHSIHSNSRRYRQQLPRANHFQHFGRAKLRRYQTRPRYTKKQCRIRSQHSRRRRPWSPRSHHERRYLLSID